MTKPYKNNITPKRNFFELLTEVIGWIQIVFSPLLLFGVIGFLVYVSNPSLTRFIVGIGITLFGLILGIVYASKVWKKHGTINFISRVSASPELDNLED